MKNQNQPDDEISSRISEKMLLDHANETGLTPEQDGWETIIKNLIVDLAHFCDHHKDLDQEPLDLDKIISQAANMYQDFESGPKARQFLHR